MKTAEEKFYQDHPRSPRQMDWIEFAESYASEQNAELRKEKEELEKTANTTIALL